MMAPKIWLVLTVGFDARGYFLGGFNLFELANKKLFVFFYLHNVDNLQLYGKDLYVPSAAPLWHRDCATSLFIVLATNTAMLQNSQLKKVITKWKVTFKVKSTVSMGHSFQCQNNISRQKFWLGAQLLPEKIHIFI